MSNSSFYIGRSFDLSSSAQPGGVAQPVHYDPDDLTTHGVIVGMTGSGKTGLLIDLLEEAAMRGLPSIVIDPKGDLSNLLLHFPDLLPTDFEPWVDPEAARRTDQTIPQLAETTAATWRNGLQGWDLGRDQLIALSQAVDYVVYTPGSSVGEKVNLLASFAPPAGLNWDEYSEVLRERISTTVTALLGLIGLRDIDPLRSREHILLSNILETAWSKGVGLDMTELILQAQNPPFERLGAFPVNSFFPEKDRFNLALMLNNFLAAPSFQVWVEGTPLDINSFFYTPQGKPRMSIFYLAHLEESERMFFVTLLLAALESWMRAQRGSPGLRALLGFDEIVGYLPPVANPPSRPVLLRLLKQARAFGLGFLLATQNPVDLDYKGLSNAGTWFIGRLQTERDKLRLLDGLESIEGGVDRDTFDKTIANLRSRVFLLHNVHAPGGVNTFQTRWTLNYLAGPLSRVQLSGLKPLGSTRDETPAPGAAAVMPASQPTLVSASPSTARAASIPTPSQPAVSASFIPPSSDVPATTRTAPASPQGVSTYFLSPELSLSQALARLGGSFAGPARPQGMLYKPALLCQAEVRFIGRRYSVDFARKFTALVSDMQGFRIDWDASQHEPVDTARLDTQPLPEARFQALPGWMSDARRLSAAQKDFTDWVYRKGSLRLYANETLKVYSSPGDTQAGFRQVCDQAAREAMQPELDKAETVIDRKLDALKNRIVKQRMIVDKNEDEVSQRRMEDLSSSASLVLGIFSKRKRSLSSSISKHRMATEAKADLDVARNTLQDLEDQFNDLQQQKTTALKEIQERWARSASDISEVPLVPQKSNIYVEVAGLAWMPVYIVLAQGQTLEVPAF